MTVIQPPLLSRRIGRTEYWPTSIEYRRDGDRLVGRVLAWGPKHTKVEPATEPTSRRGVMAASGHSPRNGQGALDL